MIRYVYFDWGTLDPSPSELAEYLLDNYEFADRLFPGKRVTDNAKTTALQMVIANVVGDRNEAQEIALAECDEAIAVLRAASDIGIGVTSPPVQLLAPLDREHFRRLVSSYASHVRRAPDKLLALVDAPAEPSTAQSEETTDDQA